MRRFHSRFTVRRMLVAIAMLAVALGGGREGLRVWIRMSTYRQMAEYSAASARGLTEAADARREIPGCFGIRPDAPPVSAERVAEMRESALYFAALELERFSLGCSL